MPAPPDWTAETLPFVIDARPSQGHAPVAGEVVGNHDVARFQRRGQELLDPAQEGAAVDRAIKYQGRHDAIRRDDQDPIYSAATNPPLCRAHSRA